MKIPKKKFFFFFFWGGVGDWVRWGSGWGVSGNREMKLAFVKIQKKKFFFFFFFWGGGGGRVGSGRVGSSRGVGGQGGCEQRSKVFVKIQKKIEGGVGVGWG